MTYTQLFSNQLNVPAWKKKVRSLESKQNTSTFHDIEYIFLVPAVKISSCIGIFSGLLSDSWKQATTRYLSDTY